MHAFVVLLHLEAIVKLLTIPNDDYYKCCVNGDSNYFSLLITSSYEGYSFVCFFNELLLDLIKYFEHLLT